MSTRDYVEEGITKARDAIKLDEEHRYAEALDKYIESLERLQLALKYQVKEKKLQAIVRGHVEKYIKRAEDLKAHLASEDSKKPRAAAMGANGASAASVASGGAKNGAKEDGGDEDNKKLRAALSGAILTETPNIKWDDVAGLAAAKSQLQQAVLLPLKFKHLFVGNRKPWKGILLYGPPGTGKSHLAKAVATAADSSTFFSVSSSDLVSKWMGESEKLVKNLFAMARENKPAIIFIDEIDALCSKRGEGDSEASRRLKTELLVQMDGVGKDSSEILVLGATNVPWNLDSAVRRRFQRRVYVGLPDLHARMAMFKIAIGETPNTLTREDFKKLAVATEGFSGSDISIVVQAALMEPIQRLTSATHYKPIMVNGVQKFTPCSPGDPDAVLKSWEEVSADELEASMTGIKDFEEAIRTTRPSVSREDLDRNAEWTKEFGSDGSAAV